MLNIKKGGHRDLERYFTLIEMDFDSEELLPKIAIHKGMMNGSLELLIAYDEDSGMDAGYALVATKNLYGYVLLKYLAVMPRCRGQGMGIQIMRLINKRYADKQGIIAELTEFLRVLRREGFFRPDAPYILSMEVTPQPGEDEDAVIAGTKRALMRAWAALEDEDT